MEFSEKLKELRKKNNMTQEQLGKALFVSRSTIAKYETGRSYPNSDIFRRIAVVFEVEESTLLSEKENRDIAIKTSIKVNNICFALLLMMIIISVSMIIFLLLPVFTYSHYLYPIPDGQMQPTLIKGQISLVTATFKKSNPIGLIAIISFMSNIAMSFSALFLSEEKNRKTLRIINAIVFSISLVLTFFTLAFAISYMSANDFSMNGRY